MSNRVGAVTCLGAAKPLSIDAPLELARIFDLLSDVRVRMTKPAHVCGHTLIESARDIVRDEYLLQFHVWVHLGSLGRLGVQYSATTPSGSIQFQTLPLIGHSLAYGT